MKLSIQTQSARQADYIWTAELLEMHSKYEMTRGSSFGKIPEWEVDMGCGPSPAPKLTH